MNVLLNHMLCIIISHQCHSRHSQCFQQESEQVLLAHIGYLSLLMCKQHIRHIKLHLYSGLKMKTHLEMEEKLPESGQCADLVVVFHSA